MGRATRYLWQDYKEGCDYQGFVHLKYCQICKLLKFIIYDNPLDIGDIILKKFNTLHKNMTFTIEKQVNNKINFLHLTIGKINTNHKFRLEYKIYRKLTTSKLSIDYNSCHPNSQKWAYFHFLLNWLNNIPLSKSNYNKEFGNILSIAKFNNYPISSIYTLNNKIKAKIRNKKFTKFNNTKKDWETIVVCQGVTNHYTQIHVGLKRDSGEMDCMIMSNIDSKRIKISCKEKY